MREEPTANGHSYKEPIFEQLNGAIALTPLAALSERGAHRGRARILALFMQKRKVSEHAVREDISEPI